MCFFFLTETVDYRNWVTIDFNFVIKLCQKLIPLALELLALNSDFHSKKQ